MSICEDFVKHEFEIRGKVASKIRPGYVHERVVGIHCPSCDAVNKDPDHGEPFYSKKFFWKEGTPEPFYACSKNRTSGVIDKEIPQSCLREATEIEALCFMFPSDPNNSTELHRLWLRHFPGQSRSEGVLRAIVGNLANRVSSMEERLNLTKEIKNEVE